jgi:hypothetical protein
MTKSCGYSLPLFDFQGYRTVLKEFSAGKGKEGMVKYRGYKNSFSIGKMLAQIYDVCVDDCECLTVSAGLCYRHAAQHRAVGGRQDTVLGGTC